MRRVTAAPATSSVSCRSGSNRSHAAASRPRAHRRRPRRESRARHVPAAARRVPPRPLEAPTIATGFHRGPRPAPAASQSIAFFRTPEVPRLYSGVAMSSASASATGGSEPCHGLGVADRLDVVVVERDLGQVEDLELDIRRRELGRPAGAPCCTSAPAGCRRSRGFASLPDGRDVGCDLDAGRPHSMSPWTRNRVFSTPSASCPVAWYGLELDRDRDLLDVSSPAIRWRSSATCSMRLEANRISGKRSVPSRSFERRCVRLAARCR